MKTFDVQIYSVNDNNIYHFECYENTEPIEMNDYFLFFFGGVADVGKCDTMQGKIEINENNKQPIKGILNLTIGFWKNCYKIKNTNINYNILDL